MGKVKSGGDLADAVDSRHVGVAAFGTLTNIDTTGQVIVAANPGRKRGVVVRCTGAQVLGVGNALADAVFLVSALGAGNNNETTVFGQGAVYVRAASSTTSCCWQEF